MAEYRLNGEIHGKLAEVHSEVKDLSSAIVDLKDAVLDLKISNKDSGNKIEGAVISLSESIRYQAKAFGTAMPLKLVLIMLLSTIVAIGIGRELDLLLKMVHP